MNEGYISTKLRTAIEGLGGVCWKTSDRFHASRPDLLFFYNGVCSVLEMKMYPNVPTNLQAYTLHQLVNVKIPTYVGNYNTNTKILWIEEWNTGVCIPFPDIRKAAEWLLKLPS